VEQDVEADVEEATFKQRCVALKNGNQVTICGDGDEIVAHAFMVDLEPDVEPLSSAGLQEEMCSSKFWHVVRFSRHVSGCSGYTIPVDHIFSSIGESLSSRQRDVKALCRTEGKDNSQLEYFVWWQWVQARTLKQESKKRKKKK
jgi:hypothetical protein